MWAYDSVFYQIYPLGMCGAPAENDGRLVPRILQVEAYIPHLQKLGVDAVYFCPVFQSDRHGYDTRDYRTIDCRLGSNEDFRQLCRHLHQAGIRVVVDGVFNHVGRGFWAFEDVREKREASPYKDWFYLNFGGDSCYHDGFWYEGWEGHYELVKLNLRNPAVVGYLLETVRMWVEEFEIDGIRLDVAYCLDRDFLRSLRGFCDSLGRELFLVGEMLHGDYNSVMNDQLLHSVTNYECYKGLYSSFNSMNLFEITHSLLRQFGPENWTLYKGKHLLAFVDNHDVTRVASILHNPAHLPLIYGLLFAMPGIPCIYYGSEWGVKGEKSQGDGALRPALPTPEWNELTEQIARYAAAHRQTPALCHGDFRSMALTNRQVVFRREFQGQQVYCAVNGDDQPFTARFDGQGAQAKGLLSGKEIRLDGALELPPYSVEYWLVQ